MHEVSEFIVVAPTNQAKAVKWAEQRLLDHLAREFPHYRFRVEPYGPFAEDDEFTVIPLVSRTPDPGEPPPSPDAFYVCKPLDPRVIPQITAALRAFDITAVRSH